MHFCQQNTGTCQNLKFCQMLVSQLSGNYSIWALQFAFVHSYELRLKEKYDSFAGTGLRNEYIIANIRAK